MAQPSHPMHAELWGQAHGLFRNLHRNAFESFASMPPKAFMHLTWRAPRWFACIEEHDSVGFEVDFYSQALRKRRKESYSYLFFFCTLAQGCNWQPQQKRQLACRKSWRQSGQRLPLHAVDQVHKQRKQVRCVVQLAKSEKHQPLAGVGRTSN